MPCDMHEVRLELAELRNLVNEIKECVTTQNGIPHDGQHLKAPQAAKHLGVSLSTLKRWREEGKGPEYQKAGPRTFLYKKSDLENWKANKSKK